jgi:hypothetical protein
MSTPENLNAPERKARSLGTLLQSVPRQALYFLLMAAITISLLIPTRLPNDPKAPGMDFYAAVMSVPPGSTVLIESDFTNSTRGESAGQLEALLRILMRRQVKFALMTVADVQAQQVARDVVERINQERIAKGEPEYQRWNDWIAVGYFPNGENTIKQMALSIRQAFAGRKDTPPGAAPRDVFESPVLKNIRNVNDLALYINVTGSKTLDILIERIKFAPTTFGDLKLKTKLGGMVTGVMGPESLNYYAAGQLFGLVVGLNGVVELEVMMENGINTSVDGKAPTIKAANLPEVPGFPGQQNYARGMKYYLALHVAMGLMILAVVAGNLGLYLTRKESREK